MRAATIAAILLCAGCGGTVASGGASTRPPATSDVSPPAPSPSASSGGSPSGEGGATQTAPPDSGVSDSGPCAIVRASDYDQSCADDGDCTVVTQVLACPASACDRCLVAAINRSAASSYRAALNAATAGEPAFPVCSCPCQSGLAVCRGGTCQPAYCGTPRADTLAACSQAGGTCVYTATSPCAAVGPADACAYADETCCL